MTRFCRHKKVFQIILAFQKKKRLAQNNISYQQLTEIYKNEGIVKTIETLRCEVDGEAGIKTKKVMDKIINYLVATVNYYSYKYLKFILCTKIFLLCY